MERNDWRLYEVRPANWPGEGEAGTGLEESSICLRRCQCYIGVGRSTQLKTPGFRAAWARGHVFCLRLPVSA